MKLHDGSHKLEKSLSNFHHLVQQHETVPQIIRNGETIRLEGYLFKRTSNTFKSWNRRWFIIQNHQLVYQKRSNEKELIIMEEDLRLCNARPAVEIDRRFCFEVVSPTKNHILQAESEESCQQWLAALQAGIEGAYSSNRASNCTPTNKRSSTNYHESSSLDSVCTNTSSNSNGSSTQSNSTLQTSIFTNQNISKMNNHSPKSDSTKILSIRGNEKCADCDCEGPVWASINLGITLCIECSGVHRSLGVHVSKVRSLLLDHLDFEQVNVMMELGNAIVNKIYEYKWTMNKFEPTSNINEDLLTEINKDSFNEQAENESLLTNSNTQNSVTLPIEKIDSKSNRSQRERWIRSKYLNKLFVNKNVQIDSPNDTIFFDTDYDYIKNFHSKVIQLYSNRNPIESNDLSVCFFNLLLYEASGKSDLKFMSYALASGASVNWQNPNDNNRTPLFQAVSKGTMTACEYLLLNGARCNIQDGNGCTPLHLATRNSNTGYIF